MEVAHRNRSELRMLQILHDPRAACRICKAISYKDAGEDF